MSTTYKTYEEWEADQKRRIQDTYVRGRQGERDKYQNTVDSLYLEHDSKEQLAKNNYNSALGTAGAKRDATHASATETRDLSYKEAERRLHAQKSEAQDSFTRSQVTYGQAAERLGQVGLTGTGLSDNLTRDVYAQRQEAVGAANAQYGVARDAADRLYSETTRAADITYADETGRAELDFNNAGVLNKATLDKGLLDAELALSQGIDKVTKERDTAISDLDLEGVNYGREAATSYTELMAGVKDGTYGAADIDRLAELYGWSEEDVGKLRGELTARQDAVANEVSKEIRDSFTPNENGEISPSYTMADIDTLAARGEISPEKAKELKDQQSNTIKKYLEDAVAESKKHPRFSEEAGIPFGNVVHAFEDINALFDAGYMTPEAHNAVLDVWNEWVYSYAQQEPEPSTKTNARQLSIPEYKQNQMIKNKIYASIDEIRADLREGLITEEEAHEKEMEITREGAKSIAGALGVVGAVMPELEESDTKGLLLPPAPGSPNLGGLRKFK